MEESKGSGASSSTSDGFQVGTLGRRLDALSAPIPSTEVFLYAPFAIVAPFWGSSSLEGTTSPSSKTSFPYLSRFLFLSTSSEREPWVRHGNTGQKFLTQPEKYLTRT